MQDITSDIPEKAGPPVIGKDSTYDEIKEKLWGELQQELQNTNDPRIFGNGNIFDTYKYVKHAKHSWAHYMMCEIFLFVNLHAFGKFTN